MFASSATAVQMWLDWDVSSSSTGRPFEVLRRVSSTATGTTSSVTTNVAAGWVLPAFPPLAAPPRPLHVDTDWPTRPPPPPFAVPNRSRAAAQQRAHALLVEHLTYHQRRQLKKHGHFNVRVAGRNFRISNKSIYHNVFELDADGNIIREFCAHTLPGCPQSDHALAQKLMLETALDDFCRVANVWDRRGERRRLVSPSGQVLR